MLKEFSASKIPYTICLCIYLTLFGTEYYSYNLMGRFLKLNMLKVLEFLIP